MHEKATRTILTLSVASAILALILLAGVSVAAFAPVASCPDGCRPADGPAHCPFCNGQGRSSLLQCRYFLQFRRREESVVLQGSCFRGGRRSPALIDWLLYGGE